MDIPPARKESVQHKFDYFAKKVLHNAMVDYMREISKLLEHEISLSDLSENSYPLSKSDTYFSESRYFDTVIGVVVVEDPDIAEVVSILPSRQREIILLYYITEKTDEEISGYLNIPRRTIQRCRKTAEQKLKEMLEEKRVYEKQE